MCSTHCACRAGRSTAGRGGSLVRVKIWSADGRILYSDESRLIGDRFALDAEELEVFERPATRSEVSDLSAPENRFERAAGRKLLEVYRPVWTPDRRPLLFETYSAYDAVTARTGGPGRSIDRGRRARRITKARRRRGRPAAPAPRSHPESQPRECR